MRRRLRETLYLVSTGSLVKQEGRDELPVVAVPPFFGADEGETEVVRFFRRPMRLADVQLSLLRWAVRSWWCRSQAAAPSSAPASAAKPLRADRPRLRLPIPVDGIVRGKVALCRRLGGVPMNRRERLAFRMALRFSADDHAV